MARYGCLPELEVHDSTVQKLASTGDLIYFLRKNPSYRISTLKDISGHGEIFRWCIRDPVELKYQQKFKEDYFKPLVSADTNQDGKPDLVAVLVRNDRFSVAIFNSLGKGRFSKPNWLVQDDPEIILGVEVTNEGNIIPHYCTGCGANPLYLWVDSNYELSDYGIGDQVCVEGGADAYLTPDLNSNVMWNIESDKFVIITRVGPKSNDASASMQGIRWYQIKSNDNPSLEGYVQSSRFGGPVDCVEDQD